MILRCAGEYTLLARSFENEVANRPWLSIANKQASMFVFFSSPVLTILYVVCLFLSETAMIWYY